MKGPDGAGQKAAPATEKGARTQESKERPTESLVFTESTGKRPEHSMVRRGLGPLPAVSPSGTETELSQRSAVAFLARIDPAAPALDEKSAAEWKAGFDRLVNLGAASVPAIAEFLRRDVDVDFGEKGRALLGYPSARTALLDALGQIGGSEGVGALGGVLQTTADPREIAILARTLEEIEPGRHTPEVLSATRQTLEMAGEGKLKGIDVAPLFEVMQKVAGVEAVPELETAARKWNYYAAVSLARLPDGAGLSTLVEMSEQPRDGGSKNLAQQMLAQMSVQNAEARAVLLEQARKGEIPATTWPYLTKLLAGAEYSVRDGVFESEREAGSTRTISTVRINSGNQNLQLTQPTQTPVEQVDAQLTFLDQLAAVTGDPAGVKAINESRRLLRSFHQAQVR